jgi:hypothetical protein
MIIAELFVITAQAVGLHVVMAQTLTVAAALVA